MAPISQYTTETVFDYTWNQVVQAYWNRYPNPSSTHVLTEDTVAREVRDGKLYSRRLLSKTNPVPKWGERFYKNAPVKIIEDSVLDPREKTLITFTRNIGFKKIMKVDEIVEYTEQRDGRTLAIRRAYISSQVFGFSRAIRAFGVERFKSNCHKAATGFNYVLRNMFPHHMLVAAAAAATATATAGPASTGTATAANNPTSNSVHHTTEANGGGKTGLLHKATKASYEYMKCQASKVAQLFSVKN